MHFIKHLLRMMVNGPSTFGARKLFRSIEFANCLSQPLLSFCHEEKQLKTSNHE